MSGPESFETARDAANANPAPASAATVPVLWIDRNGVALPPSETTGVNEAADNLTAFRNSARDSAAKSISSEFAAAIDRMRAEGVTIAEDPNAPALPVPAQLEQPVAAAAADGLPPDLAAAMQHPMVRDAIEEQLGHAERARSAYSQGLTTAHNWAQAALLVVCPELSNIPLEGVQGALNALAHVNPARYAQVSALLDQVGHLQHAQLAQAAYEQQQREAWSAAESKRFDAAVGPRSPEFSNELIAYAGELGISHEALVHLFKTENVLASAQFQHVIHTAVQARLAQKKAAGWRSKAAPKALPPVQKPGVSQPRNAASAENLNQLSNNLSRSGSLRDAAVLLAAKRKAAK